MAPRAVGRLVCALAVLLAPPVATPATPTTAALPDSVVIDTDQPLNTIVPREALGAALDGMAAGEVDRSLTPYNIEKMRSAGLRRLTYRTRAELGEEAWHWSEEGSWSDGPHAQGYWTSSDNPSREPAVTWGYSLPRRGDTVDQANDRGYSRIDDGDPASFWKSNPYLDARYAGDAASRPQWIVVSLKAAARIDAARILWGAPFARHFLVQYWRGDDQYDDDGRWVTFAHGDRTIPAEPDEAILRLSDAPVRARFLRILLLTSSGTAPVGSADIRDSLGYAVRELYFGMARPDGGLDDVIRHGRAHGAQTKIEVSSTDPWHRATDRDPAMEQPSLDLVFGSGLGGGLPAMLPVGVVYDTPENAAAEVRYIRRRGWPVSQIELGEEPDGQAIPPEDYADLYLETARALRAVDPALKLGGPSMQEAITDTWPDPEAGRSWSARFIARLKERGGLDQLQFFSFEHYPFDDLCRPSGDMLRDETDLMNQAVADLGAAGAPKSIPWVISEYGFSAFSGRQMSELPSALLASDIVGHFLSLGGSSAFMFGYPPNAPIDQGRPCAGFGNMMLFQADDDGKSHWPMPVYFAEKMMLEDWGAPADQPHQLFAVHGQALDAKGRPMAAVYPLRAPDGYWSVMLVNRDEGHAHRMRILLRDHGRDRPLGGGHTLSVVQYSSAQYVWLDKGEESHPVRDLPPARFRIEGGQPVLLPGMSLTVVSDAEPGS